MIRMEISFLRCYFEVVCLESFEEILMKGRDVGDKIVEWVKCVGL